MKNHILKVIIVIGILLSNIKITEASKDELGREFNSEYAGDYLNRVAFPIGGIGAGMVCLEGTGAISHVSVRNAPDVFNEPYMFAALCVKNNKGNIAKVIEGPVPEWKHFGTPETGVGSGRSSYGLPRFDDAKFLARFPFGIIKLGDDDIPLNVEITGWSPFIPGDPDNSSMPVGALEYHFINSSGETQEAIFSFNSQNFMHIPRKSVTSTQFEKGELIKEFQNGFLLWRDGTEENPHYEGGFAIFVDDEDVKVNHHWFRGSHFDAKTINWQNIQSGVINENPPVSENTTGASLFIPFRLKAGEEKTIRLKFCWFVPHSNLRTGEEPDSLCMAKSASYCESKTYVPWYAGRFRNINDLAKYWSSNYNDLYDKTKLFSNTFYESTLPEEVIEAVAANLTILKSPTILRQTNGKIWAWEGCRDKSGAGPGSCTHVWNYAQAIPHLFPSLERTLRDTEFNESQSSDGYQIFRSYLPIRKAYPKFQSAVDGQLGGIMKIYREWRISADNIWLKGLWPKVKKSMDYCIKTWDPKHKGFLEEPQHNTYDIEFWGPNGMCTSFYLGALTAAINMATALNDTVNFYTELLEKGKEYMETELFNDEYFIQKIQWQGLIADDPVESAKGSWHLNYSPEAIVLFEKEGPKYQYGNGCLSDGVLGLWLAKMCGIENNIIDPIKIKSHLNSVYKYNLRKNLSDHVNPQRPSYALGNDGGLLLCTWPRGGKQSLPLIYSDEVWTGIEYQVASHLILNGMVDEGLDIVKTCRKRYDGRVRNPFNEYEYGHWYARALSSYGLLQALTGIRYDAVDRTLYINSQVGNDFKSFISTATGFGIAGLDKGKPFIDVRMGEILINNCVVSGYEAKIKIID